MKRRTATRGKKSQTRRRKSAYTLLSRREAKRGLNNQEATELAVLAEKLR